MAHALYYILNIVWPRNAIHNKNIRHVSPITDSLTVQGQTCSDADIKLTVGQTVQETSSHKKNSVLNENRFISGRKNVASVPLIVPEKVHLPPLHNKL
jgi:hypothetical protein